MINYKIAPSAGTIIDKDYWNVHNCTYMRGILEMSFEQYNAVLSAEWKFTMNRTTGIARGGCASTSPKHVGTLANLPDFTFNNGFTIRVTKPRYIQPS